MTRRSGGEVAHPAHRARPAHAPSRAVAGALRVAVVAGARGQLGRALGEAAPPDWRVIACGREDLDLTREASVASVMRTARPDVVINAAAYTAVDRAERDPAAAAAVNSEGARRLAAAAHAIGARVVHISTDYVFDGRTARPLRPQDLTAPLNVYGRTKRDGEVAVREATDGAALVLRTAWLYSASGPNFVQTILRRCAAGEPVDVVDGQTGSPTWAAPLARVVWAAAMHSEFRGVHHWADEGAVSRLAFAEAIRDEALRSGRLRRSVPIRVVSAADRSDIAARPAYSALDASSTEAALGVRRLPWRENLRACLETRVAAHVP